MRVTRCFLLLALAFLGGPAAAEFVVTQVSTFSGSQAVTGKAMHAGARLYIDHVNAVGGVRGQRIRFVTRDDGGRPEDTVAQVHEALKEDDPIAFLLTVGTANLNALAEDGALARAGAPMIGPVSGATTIPKVPEFVTTKASYHDETARLMLELSTVGIKSVGVMYQDDGYGKDVLAGVEKAAKEHGMQVVVRATYERNTVKVETAVNAMLLTAPPVIILGAVTAPAAEFVKQYKELGGTSAIYGVSVVDTEALLKRIGPDAARGYAFSRVMPYKPSLAIVREYEALKAKAGNLDGLSGRSMEGFVAAKLLVEALRHVERPTRAAVVQYLRGRQFDLGDYFLDYSQPGRAASSYVDFAVIGTGGRIVY